MKIRHSLTALLAVAAFAFASISFAGVDTQSDDNGVTLAGYDAVAYFTQNSAVAGKSSITAVHNNAIYYFSSTENRDLFNANPSKYEPQYGGFCAYGTALGKKLPVDGKAFEIVDGKLYVNKNLDVYETWVEDKAANIQSANQQWPTIKNIAADQL